MKATTVKQPWAWAIATGAKTVENRGRSVPWTSGVGERIALHAGMGWDDGAFVKSSPLWDLASAVIAHGDGEGKVPGALLMSMMLPQFHYRGAVMATAVLADVHTSDVCPDVGANGLCSPWAQPDAWHLVLRDIRAVREPVRCRGYQGLWTVPADVEQQVIERTRAAA